MNITNCSTIHSTKIDPQKGLDVPGEGPPGVELQLQVKECAVTLFAEVVSLILREEKGWVVGKRRAEEFQLWSRRGLD